MNTRSKGKVGEQVAREFYEGRGFKVCNPSETRFSENLAFGDLYYWNESELGFCEVKATKEQSFSLKEYALKVEELGLPVRTITLEFIWVRRGKVHKRWYYSARAKEFLHIG